MLVVVGRTFVLVVVVVVASTGRGDNRISLGILIVVAALLVIVVSFVYCVVIQFALLFLSVAAVEGGCCSWMWKRRCALGLVRGTQ